MVESPERVRSKGKVVKVARQTDDHLDRLPQHARRLQTLSGGRPSLRRGRPDRCRLGGTGPSKGPSPHLVYEKVTDRRGVGRGWPALNVRPERRASKEGQGPPCVSRSATEVDRGPPQFYHLPALRPGARPRAGGRPGRLPRRPRWPLPPGARAVPRRLRWGRRLKGRRPPREFGLAPRRARLKATG